MKPLPFEYQRPPDLATALETLSDFKGGAVPLAGGQSLVPLLNFRLASPAAVIDLASIAELAGVSVVGETVTVGAMTPQGVVERHPGVRQHLPILAEAVRHIGFPAIRSRGTVGGSIAHADPAAELPAVALALDAEVQIASRENTRWIEAEDFFQGYYTTACREDELVTAVRFPIRSHRLSSFTEYSRRSGSFALVGVAVSLVLEGRHVAEASIALSGVGSVPFRSRALEAILVNEAPGSELFHQIAQQLAATVDPPTDVHGSADYRRRLVEHLTFAALTNAWGKRATQ